MMKVGVLTLISRRAGGLFYSVRWLSKALQDEGCDVQVFSARDKYTAQDFSVWDPLNIQLYTGLGPLQSSPDLRSYLTKSDADLLHVHGLWLDRQWASLRWQKLTGNPVILSPRGMLDTWALRNSAWKKKLAGALFANESLRRASCIHALCRSEAESIRAYGLKNPIALIPNGIQLPDSGPMNGNASADSVRTILFLGRIHPKKGIEELLRGWHTALKRNPDGFDPWRLVIAGWDDGGHLPRFEALKNELGMAGSVKFVGEQYGEAKDRLLRSADAFVLPSFSEGLPMSVLEAWAYGLPVLMTDHCNLPEGFSANAALRITPDAEAIAAGLEQFIGLSVDERRGLGINGRALVEKKFTWPGIARDMKAVYEWCLGGGDAPSCVMED